MAGGCRGQDVQAECRDTAHSRRPAPDPGTSIWPSALTDEAACPPFPDAASVVAGCVLRDRGPATLVSRASKHS